MAIVEVNIVPIGTGSSSIRKPVSDAVKVLEKERDVAYQVTSAGTVLEGELDKLMNVVRRMHESGFAEGAKRVQSTIIIDDRRDKPQKVSEPL
ncbi:MAG: MTH1187 family thiamine-binding protein [Dehalococcoidia bacterium]|nr:MTH1187 family thiamine-binding protein [Dehalococcoidia bacterium]